MCKRVYTNQLIIYHTLTQPCSVSITLTKLPNIELMWGVILDLSILSPCLLNKQKTIFSSCLFQRKQKQQSKSSSLEIDEKQVKKHFQILFFAFRRVKISKMFSIKKVLSPKENPMQPRSLVGRPWHIFEGNLCLGSKVS